MTKSLEIVIAVWGEWHRNAFLRLNLATLMCESNLPKLVDQMDCRWTFYTTAEDKEKFLRSRLFAAFAELVDIDWVEVAQSERDDFSGIDVHGQVWIEGMARAQASNNFVMFMPPDIAWSEGGFGHFADLIAAGKRAIYINWHLRAIAETFIPEFLETYANEDEPIAIPAKNLVRMCVEHIHPLSSVYLRDSTFVPPHSEMVFWPVPGSGLLMHVLALTPFLFDTSRFEYTDRKLITAVPDPEELHFVTDSDDLFIASLTELDKDRDWYEVSNPFDFARLAAWWHYYDSPGNDYLLAAPFRLKFADGNESEWRRKERAAQNFLCRAVAAREVYRIWKIAKEQGCHLAGFLIAYILRTNLSHCIVNRLEPSTIFLPTDTALRAPLEGWASLLLNPRHFKTLRRFIFGHVVPTESLNFPELNDGSQALNEPGTEVVSQSGDSITVRRVSSAHSLMINDARVIGAPIRAGLNNVIIIDRPLLSLNLLFDNPDG